VQTHIDLMAMRSAALKCVSDTFICCLPCLSCFHRAVHLWSLSCSGPWTGWPTRRLGVRTPSTSARIRGHEHLSTAVPASITWLWWRTWPVFPAAAAVSMAQSWNIARTGFMHVH